MEFLKKLEKSRSKKVVLNEFIELNEQIQELITLTKNALTEGESRRK